MTTPQPFREVRSRVRTEKQTGPAVRVRRRATSARGWYQMSAVTGRLFGVAGAGAEYLLVRDFGAHEQADAFVADGPARVTRLVVAEQRVTPQAAPPLPGGAGAAVFVHSCRLCPFVGWRRACYVRPRQLSTTNFLRI